MMKTFSIPGIHCSACKALIQDVSTEFPGINVLSVDVPSHTVTLQHNATFDCTAWIRAVEDLGPAFAVSSSVTPPDQAP